MDSKLQALLNTFSELPTAPSLMFQMRRSLALMAELEVVQLTPEKLPVFRNQLDNIVEYALSLQEEPRPEGWEDELERCDRIASILRMKIALLDPNGIDRRFLTCDEKRCLAMLKNGNYIFP